MSEDELIRWLRRLSGSDLIGDDAAILPDSDQWAVTMDTQIAGVHFREESDPADVARRLVAVNLSDIAATGASPTYAFLALAAPTNFDHQRFFSALVRCCGQFDLELAGGDLAKHSQTTAVMTILGRKAAGQRWLRRSEAHPGEALWLGGTVGEAAAGLKLLTQGARFRDRKVHLPAAFKAPAPVLHAARRAVRRQLLPQPQLALGDWLGTQEEGAAIDVSDGLTLDLHRLCSASEVGAELAIERLPLADRFQDLCRRLGSDWRKLALGGGEDYVLLFTLPAGVTPPREFGCSRIGRIVPASTINVVEDGRRTPMSISGWDHLQSSNV